MTKRQRQRNSDEHDTPGVGLSAVIVAVSGDEPKVLAIRSGEGRPDALPFGPLETHHRTLEAGLRSWVERQTHQSLGYVEQLYTFGDRDRLGAGAERQSRMLSIGYLALVREARPEGAKEAQWRDWYRYFPWEDRRAGTPRVLALIE